MTAKDTARRISSLFSLGGSNQDSSGSGTASRGRNPGATSTTLAVGATRQLSESAITPPSPASLAPPSQLGNVDPSVRGRPHSYISQDQPRRLWRPRSKANLKDETASGPQFWWLTGQSREPYDVTNLITLQKVSELWDDEGDTLVYLCSRNRVADPSFKITSSLFASSSVLTTLARGIQRRSGSPHVPLESAAGRLNLRWSDSPATSPIVADDEVGSSGSGAFFEAETPAQELHLHLPVDASTSPGYISPVAGPPIATQPVSDLSEQLVSMRNLFAFLTRQPLIASNKHPTAISVFLRIADDLHDLKFSNFDQSTYGEAALDSFQHYIEAMNLQDVRKSWSNTTHALILSERMRSAKLYKEAFVHAVGMYESLSKHGDLFGKVSEVTRNRLERASMELQTRISTVSAKLTDFDFPSLFAGIASSTKSDESKSVHFGAWKSSFGAMRRHILGYYKHQFGSWPPKANKKTGFEAGGLNRVVLQVLYQDLSDLYDLLVDRRTLTPRLADMLAAEEEEEEEGEKEGVPGRDPDLPATRALRKVMSEFDKSSPPVQPPMPYDTPRLPRHSRSHVASAPSAMGNSKERIQRLKDPEIGALLGESYNEDADRPTPFLNAFKAFERKAAQGKSINELCDQRDGHWIFLYAVLQALPMLVVDAPDLKFTDGVEYFLCQPPKGGFPWVPKDHQVKKSWYGVAGGTGLVSLPADLVDHGVEGIYRRSHCWVAAERWAAPAIHTETIHEAPAICADTISEASHTPSPVYSLVYEASAPSVAGSESLYSPSLASPASPLHSPSGFGPSGFGPSGFGPSGFGPSAGAQAQGRLDLPPSLPSSSLSRRRSAISPGLEALPLPDGVMPGLEAPSRPTSGSGPNSSFSDILPQKPAASAAKQNRKRWQLP